MPKVTKQQRKYGNKELEIKEPEGFYSLLIDGANFHPKKFISDEEAMLFGRERYPNCKLIAVYREGKYDNDRPKESKRVPRTKDSKEISKRRHEPRSNRK